MLFLYFFRLGRSSLNNMPPKSPVKKGKKADKGKVVADEPEDKEHVLVLYLYPVVITNWR